MNLYAFALGFCRIQGLGCRIRGLGYRIRGLGYRIVKGKTDNPRWFIVNQICNSRR